MKTRYDIVSGIASIINRNANVNFESDYACAESVYRYLIRELNLGVEHHVITREKGQWLLTHPILCYPEVNKCKTNELAAILNEYDPADLMEKLIGYKVWKISRNKFGIVESAG